MVLLHLDRVRGPEERLAGFSARSALVRRLAMKKAVFGGDTQIRLQAHRDTARPKRHRTKQKQNNE
jgi:hypothetical protein